jgi:hypothetical protein
MFRYRSDPTCLRHLTGRPQGAAAGADSGSRAHPEIAAPAAQRYLICVGRRRHIAVMTVARELVGFLCAVRYRVEQRLPNGFTRMGEGSDRLPHDWTTLDGAMRKAG